MGCRTPGWTIFLLLCGVWKWWKWVSASMTWISCCSTLAIARRQLVFIFTNFNVLLDIDILLFSCLLLCDCPCMHACSQTRDSLGVLEERIVSKSLFVCLLEEIIERLKMINDGLIAHKESCGEHISCICLHNISSSSL